MKTTQELVVKHVKPGVNIGTYKRKWVQNYLPQLAMYSDAKAMDWMLLLLISKRTGQFSLIPVNAHSKLEWLRENGQQVI